MTELDMKENLVEEVESEDIDADVDPRVYELGYHIIPALSEEEAPREASALKDFIKEKGGVVISEEAPQHMTLAYPMYRTEGGKKETFESAHFGGIKFEIDPENVGLIKEVLDSNNNILRHIIFKTVRENTRAEVRLPQARTERKPAQAPKAEAVSEKEKEAPVSEKALDESIKEIVVE